MNRLKYVLPALAAVAVLLPQAVQTPRPLAGIIPAGPLIYIEAKDFGALLKDWTDSNEKKMWLASDSYKVFAQSRLFLRLKDAQQGFEKAAAVVPDMPLVDGAAGGNSALALYDIGNLEFLYITRMPSARAYETILWQSRAKFSPRKSAGIDYYVRQEQRRLAAFAVTNDLLLIATEEQVMASALALLAGQSPPAMMQEPWYQRATAAQQTPGEVRLALNFERAAKTPYFRSYWVQRNTSDLKQFNAVISDLDRTPAEYRERRTLLRAEPAADLRPAEAAVGEISRFAPAEAGLFRLWAKPETGAVLALIEQKIIAPRAANPEERYRRAPEAGNVDAALGSEEDLETRIDEAPVVDDASKVDLQPLRVLLEGNTIEAMMQVETSRPAADGVFVSTPRAVALLGSKPWNAAAARAADERPGAPRALGAGDAVRPRQQNELRRRLGEHRDEQSIARRARMHAGSRAGLGRHRSSQPCRRAAPGTQAQSIENQQHRRFAAPVDQFVVSQNRFERSGLPVSVPPDQRFRGRVGGQRLIERQMPARGTEYLLLATADSSTLAQRWDDARTPAPLGSLVKPFIALAFGEAHLFAYPVLECTGCWLPGGHGRIGIRTALAQSCNSYFGRLAGLVRVEDVDRTARRYGLTMAAPLRSRLVAGTEPRGSASGARNESIALGAGMRFAALLLACAAVRGADGGHHGSRNGRRYDRRRRKSARRRSRKPESAGGGGAVVPGRRTRAPRAFRFLRHDALPVLARTAA